MLNRNGIARNATAPGDGNEMSGKGAHVRRGPFERRGEKTFSAEGAHL
jgi:hypothetical protein